MSDPIVYRTGRAPDHPLLAASLPEFRAAYPEVPEASWAESDQFEVFSPPVTFQVQNGCVGHGGRTAFWIAWLASGLELPGAGFSPTWAYALINHGRDQGAFIGDLIDALQTAGMATADVFPEEKYMLGGPAEQAARPVARNYLLDDAYRISTYEEKGTALHMGYAVADSVEVWSVPQFSRLDADGFAPVFRGPGDHCVCPGGIRRLRGKVGFRNQNSWGTGWGQGGYFFTSKEHILSQGRGYSGVVFRSVKPGPDFVPPKVA